MDFFYALTHCLLCIAHFHLDSSIPVSTLLNTSGGFPLYYGIHTTTTIPTHRQHYCTLIRLLQVLSSAKTKHKINA